MAKIQEREKKQKKATKENLLQCLNLHATRMTRLSSMAPPENHGLDARHVSSALSFSEVTFKVKMLVVIFESCNRKKEIKKNVFFHKKDLLLCV